MTENDSPAPSRSAAEDARSGPTSDFAGVARRVSRWAVNLLASGVILIAGLALGRQALQWWSAGDGRPAAGVIDDVLGPDPLAAGGDAQLLQFGDFPLLVRRRQLAGDASHALAALRGDCRLAAGRVQRVPGAAGAAERRMLAGVRRMQPVEATAAWRMYQVEAPWPMVVAVGEVAGEAAEAAAAGQVAARQHRVVSWGLAFPVVSQQAESGDVWTLFTFAADDQRETMRGAADALPLPPGGRRTMSLAAENGARMVGFRGSGPAPQWMDFYDRRLGGEGWYADADWLHQGRTWQRRFRHPQAGRLDVYLIVEADRRLNGLLLTAGPVDTAAEK